jgi:putative ABC transport system permease protein
MRGIALKMLFGDRAKYLGMVFGVALSTLLITQQSALFYCLMTRTASVIDDAREADIWVMDPQAKYVDTVRPMRDTELARVRGVPGVAWAVPLYKATAAVKTLDGALDNALLIGLDDASLIGGPRRFALGSIESLRAPDAVAIDRAGYALLWPGQPERTGRELELNDRRAVVTAITEASAAFTSRIVIYTRYNQALTYVPQPRNQLTFVLARAAAGQDPSAVAATIAARTGLQARSAAEFRRQTIGYYLVNTGIPISFGIVILLGVIVGVAVVGLTFNMFVADNLRQFGALKAIGTTNRRLIGMVLVQAGMVGATGYGLGLGFAAAFFEFATRGNSDLRGFYLPWWIAAGVAGATASIILLAILTGMRRVLVLDPAIVFRA